MKPVYVINGFLESGKTEFITYTLAQPYFQVRGKHCFFYAKRAKLNMMKCS